MLRFSIMTYSKVFVKECYVMSSRMKELYRKILYTIAMEKYGHFQSCKPIYCVDTLWYYVVRYRCVKVKKAI